MLVASGVVVVCLVAGAAVAYFVVFRTSATPVGVRQAVRTFRAHVGRAGVPVGAYLPPPGVYVYATSGYEELSIPGTHRGWPSRTTATLTGSACGETLTWMPLVEHVETYDLCRGPGASLRLARSTTAATFLGIATHDTATCGPDAWLRPPVATPGRTWTFTCRAGKVLWSATARVVADDAVRVGRVAVPAVRVHVDIRYSGDETGTSPSDYWFERSDNLLLRYRGTTDLSQGSSPLGSVHYSQRFALTLTSITPRG